MSSIRDITKVRVYQHRKTGSAVNAVRVKGSNWGQMIEWLREALSVLPDSGLLSANESKQEALIKIRGEQYDVRPGYTIILNELDSPTSVFSNSSLYRRYRVLSEGAAATTLPGSSREIEVLIYNRPALERVEAVQHLGQNLPQLLQWAAERAQEWPGPVIRAEVLTLDSPQGPRRLEYGDYLVLSIDGVWRILTQEQMDHTYAKDEPELVGSVGDALDVLLCLQRRIEDQWNRLPEPDNPESVSQYIREVALCLEDELHEALEHVHWKPWKTSRGFKDVAKYREELADVLHFVLDLYIAAGMNGKDIYQDYLAKHQENVRRRSSEEYIES